MKTRSSFVANSSSSSFIIGCIAYPNTMEEAGKLWFDRDADFIAPVILKGLYNELKPMKLDLDKMLEMAKTLKWEDIQYPYDEENIDKEMLVLYELSNIFEYDEESEVMYGMRCFSSDSKRPYCVFKRKEEDKICKKHGAKRLYDIKDLNHYEFSKMIEAKWFNKKENRERWAHEVECFVRRFKSKNVYNDETKDFQEQPLFLMEGSFEDDSHLGSELEHGAHWEKFPVYQRFSHH